MLVVNVKFALRALRAHRLRSALTMLGVIIGVAALVVMVAVGNGARERVAAQIRSLGANLVAVHQGSLATHGVQRGKGTAQRLSEADAAAIDAEVPDVVAVAPVLLSQVQFTAGPANWRGIATGVTPDYFTSREWHAVDGREITPEDNDRAAKVVLLGATVRNRLFAGRNPVGATVRLREVPFTVIGVMGRKGESIEGDDQDDVALVPLSTARQQLVGINRASPRAVPIIFVKFAPGASARQTMAAIADLLRERHGLRPGQEDSFVLNNLADVGGAERAATHTVSALLAAVALVSLLVGGIGIMNIMLVSVAERTREIGLRMAVGAWPRDILAQFLTEAATLAILGGALGALVGIGGSLAIGHMAGWSVLIDPGTVLLAVAFAGFVGVFFGVFPARRAARLDPIVALRHE